MTGKQSLFQAGKYALLAGLLLALVLPGCGGGGGSSAPATSSTPTTPTTPSAPSGSLSLAADCSGSNCSATGSSYSGSGIGVWSVTNSTSVAAEVPVSITGASGKTATLVWTNPNGGASLSAPASVGARMMVPADGDRTVLDQQLAALAAQREKAQALLSGLANSRQSDVRLSMKVASRLYALNDSVTWNQSLNNDPVTPITTTLRGQASLSNGQKVNIWVENSEWNKGGTYQITQSLVDLLSEKFASASGSGIFGMLTSLAGSQPWGAHQYSNLIGANQDIQIVVSNFDHNNKAGGVIGYFDATNNYLKTAYSSSNEALMFFLDSESLAWPDYRPVSVSTLAHEFTHMINFYQYTILKSAPTMFDTWYDELLAMMAEDIVDGNLGNFNNLRDASFAPWVNSSAYNCSLTSYVGDTNDSCFSYDIYAAYGGYLLRHYGLGLFKTLAQTSESNSLTALGKALAAYGGDTATTLRRWGSTVALMNSSQLPAWNGYPLRTETVNNISYTLPAINGPDFAQKRSVPATLPSSVKPYAHAVQTMPITSSTFSRKVTVPAGMALSVIIN